MQAAIVIFPGSNREHDLCLAWKLATGREPLRVWHGDASLPDADLIILPGGFAHGDYLRCGAMAARAPIMREVKARAERGTRSEERRVGKECRCWWSECDCEHNVCVTARHVDYTAL